MDHDSLFGSGSEDDSDADTPSNVAPEVSEKSACSNESRPASFEAPKIDGLYLFRGLLPLELQEVILPTIFRESAVTHLHPQAMLFPRSHLSKNDIENCPEYLVDLVTQLPELLRPHLSQEDFGIVFDESQPLQTIINLYEPGQGITPHVSTSGNNLERKEEEVCQY